VVFLFLKGIFCHRAIFSMYYPARLSKMNTTLVMLLGSRDVGVVPLLRSEFWAMKSLA